MFTDNDIRQIEAKGLGADQVLEQINHFRTGFPALPIVRAAVVGDGIVPLSAQAAATLARSYDVMMEAGVCVQKFVPASGAASRMFKELFEAVDGGSCSASRPEYRGNSVADTVCENIEKFAFCDLLREQGVDLQDKRAVITGIVGREGLDYGRMPKGLLLFHRYSSAGAGDSASAVAGREVRTALEEHLVEAALYGGSACRKTDAAASDNAIHTNKQANIHFTVSPEHRKGFLDAVAQYAGRYSDHFGVKYSISYSEQKSATDIVAVDMENRPFREADGSLLFRPAGHGALIDNLDELHADIIFIKTIDNVVPDHLKGDTVLYKKALGGMAYGLREQLFEYIRQIDNSTASAGEIIEFIDTHIGYRLGDSTSFEELRVVLDRPLRVCGMVRNQGEPGGGPFWVHEDGGVLSLQIAESSQIAPEQRALMAEATHFNPVDLVCCTTRHDGSYFNLKDYVDPQTGFISVKSKDGRELKAQELPGLWNGAMAKWNTVFVEVPITTFAPVKSVVDLLRSEHQ